MVTRLGTTPKHIQTGRAKDKRASNQLAFDLKLIVAMTTME